jgi:hypothetical protein
VAVGMSWTLGNPWAKKKVVVPLEEGTSSLAAAAAAALEVGSQGEDLPVLQFLTCLDSAMVFIVINGRRYLRIGR